MKNYTLLFHNSWAANEFARKQLKKFTKLIFFLQKKKISYKNKIKFHKIKINSQNYFSYIKL